MVMRSPTLTIVSGGMLLALASTKNRLAVEARNAVERLARRHDMDARRRRERSSRRPDRRRRRHAAADRGDTCRRRRESGRRPAAARDHQMLPGTHASPGRVMLFASMMAATGTP